LAWVTVFLLTSVVACETGFAATGATLAVNRGTDPGGQVVPAQSGYVPKRKRPLTSTTGPKRSLEGTLTAVNLGSESLTVQPQQGNKVGILIDDRTRFFVGGQQVAFPSLKPGAKVSVTFFESGGTLVADVVQVY